MSHSRPLSAAARHARPTRRVRRRTLTLLGSVLPMLGPAVAHTAPEATADIEEVYVVSSRVPLREREIGTAVSVIDREELEQRGFNSVVDILRTEPGVSASSSGGIGAATSLRIRGEDGYRTKVFVDGIDLTDTSGPQFSPRLEHLLTSGLERIEILRGPQGMLYGADAGGVINITTITPGDRLAGQLSAEAGGYGTEELAGHLALGAGPADLVAGLTRFRTDGFNARTTDVDLRDDDGYQNTSLHGRVGVSLGERFRLSAAGRRSEGDNDYDACFRTDTFANTDDCRDEFIQDSARVALSYEGDSTSQELALASNRTDREFRSAGVTSFATRGQLDRASWLGRWRPSEQHGFVLGLEHERQHLEDGTFDRRRQQTGSYLEYQGRFGTGLTLTAGARHDDNDEFGSFTSSRLSAAWVRPFAAGDIKLRASYGTGFRAPSLYEIAYNAGPFAAPPAAEVSLREERSEGYDLGLVWSGKDGRRLELSYFDQQVEDLIVFDLLGFSGYLQDSGRSTSEGIETAVAWPLAAGFFLTANYTWNDTATAAGQPRPRRPEHAANAGLRFAGDRVDAGVFLRTAQGARDSAAMALDDYTVMDANVSYRPSAGFELFARIENALAERYSEVPTYRTPGRTVYAGLRYRFGRETTR